MTSERRRLDYTSEGPGRRELSFVIGVMADLSGRGSETLPPVHDRKFVKIDVDGFDRFVERIQPRVSFLVPNTLTHQGHLAVELVFECMADFTPGRVARKVPSLRRLLIARTRLTEIVRRGGVDEPIERIIERVINEPTWHASTDSGPSAEIAPADLQELELPVLRSILEPDALLATGWATRERGDASLVLSALVAKLDRMISDQVNHIIHYPDFQNLESAWRGLRSLVTSVDPHLGAKLFPAGVKILVMDISKRDLRSTLSSFEDPAESPIFKRISEEIWILGSEPFACILGDYYFNHSHEDVELLRAIAWISASTQAPFIAGAAPSLLGLESWEDIASTRDVNRVFDGPDRAIWQSLRSKEETRHIGLTLPRILARRPYGAEVESVEDFDFEEDTNGPGLDRYCWANAAYALVASMARSFAMSGWCRHIRGVEEEGVEDLPVHPFPTAGGAVHHRSTEIAINDRLEYELAKLGLIPLVDKKDKAVFISVMSLHQPAIYDDPDANASAAVAARLNYLIDACRLIHYLRCIAYEGLGEREHLERKMNGWLRQAVSRPHEWGWPVTDAVAEIEEVLADSAQSNPAAWKLVLRVRPRIEGVVAWIRLTSALRTFSGDAAGSRSRG